MSRSTNWRTSGVSRRRSTQGSSEAESSGSDAGDSPSASSVTDMPDLPGLDPDDIDPDELRDFMSADGVDVKADPVFREQLRQKLWKMLRASNEGGEGEDEG